MEMDAFMKCSKLNLKFENYPEVHVVMGNSACDLDSVVSALVYSFYLWKKTPDANTVVIPLLNISREELRIRNEVLYFLKRCTVDVDNLCFRENVDLQALHDLNKLKLILVDHNELTESDCKISSSVVEVIDHHSVEHNNTIEKDKMRIEMVGSCCTLVAEKLLLDRKEIIDNQVALLLLGTILLDTVNLDDKAKRVTEKDKVVAAQLQEMLPNLDTTKLFEDIQEAKFDISGLSLSDILRKDVKMISSKTMNIIVPSLSVLVEAVLKYPTIENELEGFRNENQCHAVVMMGIFSNRSGEIVRQIAVYSQSTTCRDQVVEALQTSQPSLDMISFPSGFASVAAFHQGNFGASRKAVLPVLRRFVAGGLPNNGKNQDGCKTTCLVQNENITSSVTQHQSNTCTQKVLFTNSDGLQQGEISPAIGGETNELFLGPPHQFLGAGDPWSTVTSSKNSSNQNSCPYTPLNSVAESESGIDQYAMHILPSFNSRDMLEKIAKKRNKLGEYVGDLSVTDTYPYTPKNSYVEGSFETYAKGLPHFDAHALFLKVEEQKCTQEYGLGCLAADRSKFPDCITEETERVHRCEISASNVEEKASNGGL